MKTILTAFSGILLTQSLFAAEPVSVREEPLVLPTYAMGAPDRTPIFLERRSYQGAEAPVYPYPMLDAMTDHPVSKSYKAVYLENRFVQICVLPEIGGRVFSARDKSNGYDFLYHQHVIKPALIGMVGAWISGGIEWNIPHHHRASTFMPVDYSVAQGADGSATIRVGELELRHRMRWVVELTLRPDSSCVEQTVRLVNRTAQANSFLYFANIAVPANPDYQVIFPPDTHWVTNHGKREFSKWPVSDSIYNAIDFRRGVDVSRWKNHPSPVSMFCWGSSMDFLAGYDHGKQAGFVNISDHHLSPGKKFFTWGGGTAGQMWDRVLTEADGPYIELMAGSYSNNQPDYSWIQPYQTKTVDAFWYPVARIGGVKNATRYAAVNLEVTPENLARVAVAVTAEQPELTVTLSGAAGLLFEQKGSASPAKPFFIDWKLPPTAGKLTVRVTAGGRELVAYSMVDPASGEAPEPVRPPDRPESIANVEEVYFAGLRLEQFHSAALDPEDYYREVLRRDPGHVAANTALGIRAYQRCLYPEAEKFLTTAIKRISGSYLAPKTGDAHYFLGLALRAQHQDQAARNAFERAAWVAGWESPAGYQLAEMSCSRGDFAQALVHLDRALSANASNAKALTLKAAVLRKLGRQPENAGLLARALALDPLDPWPVWERALSTGGVLPKNGDDPQASLEPASDYATAGLWDDAISVLASATGKAASHPMVRYAQAFYLEKIGKPDEAAAQYAAAAAAEPDGVFPFRQESLEILLRARERNPQDHRAAYYLGNLHLLHGQVEQAIQQWEESRRLNPAYAMVHRNLSVTYSRLPGGLPRAIESLQTAIAREPHEARFYLELDQLQEASGVAAADRLAWLEKNQEVITKRDDSLAREISLLVEVGLYDNALSLLQGRQFHIWEGAGRTAVHNSYAEAHLILGHRHAEAGRYHDAVKEYTAALEYPVNLGTGRPLRGERLSETYYYLGKTYESLGDREMATRQFLLAVESAPASLIPTRPGAIDEPEVYYYAARSLEKCGRGEESALIYQGLVEAGKAQLADHLPMYFFTSFGSPQPEPIRFAQAHVVIGLGLLGANKTAEAQQEFQQALQLNTNLTAAKKWLHSTH